MRSQLFRNFDGYSLKNGAATPLTIWNFSRAWQAYFLSNNLQIWWENTSFNDLQMIWNNVFDTSIGFWFEKIWLSCTVHTYSLYLSKWSILMHVLGALKSFLWKGHVVGVNPLLPKWIILIFLISLLILDMKKLHEKIRMLKWFEFCPSFNMFWNFNYVYKW